MHHDLAEGGEGCPQTLRDFPELREKDILVRGADRTGPVRFLVTMGPVPPARDRQPSKPPSVRSP